MKEEIGKQDSNLKVEDQIFYDDVIESKGQDGYYTYTISGKKLNYRIEFLPSVSDIDERIIKVRHAINFYYLNRYDMSLREIFKLIKKNIGIQVVLESKSISALPKVDAFSVLKPLITEDMRSRIAEAGDISIGMKNIGFFESDRKPPEGGMSSEYVGNVWVGIGGTEWLLRHSDERKARILEFCYLFETEIGIPSAEIRFIANGRSYYTLNRYIGCAFPVEEVLLSNAMKKELAKHLISDYLLGDGDRHGQNFLVQNSSDDVPLIVSIDHSEADLQKSFFPMHMALPQVLSPSDIKAEYLADQIAIVKSLTELQLKSIVVRSGLEQGLADIIRMRINRIDDEIDLFFRRCKDNHHKESI